MQIEINEKQLNCIRDACEFYHRFWSGQLDYFPPDLFEYFHNQKIDIDEVRKTLAILKNQLFPQLLPNQDYGWDSDHFSSASLSYEIYREILHQQLKDDKHWNIYKSETLTSSGNSLIRIKD